MKLKKIILYVVPGLFLLFFLGLIILYLLRNSLLESRLETVLSQKLETEVTITGLNLSVFNPGIEIREFTVVKKNDPATYLVKSGKIEVSLSLLPIILNKTLDIEKIHLTQVDFLVPAKGKRKKETPASGDLDKLIASINTEEILTRYAEKLKSIEYAAALSSDVERLERELQKTIGETDQMLTTAETELNALISHDLSSIESAEEVLKRGELTYKKIETTHQQLLSLQKRIEKEVNSTQKAIAQLQSLIEQDIGTVVNDIANPKHFAIEIGTEIIKQMLHTPVSKYHAMLNAALELLEETQKKSEKTSLGLPTLSSLVASIKNPPNAGGSAVSPSDPQPPLPPTLPNREDPTMPQKNRLPSAGTTAQEPTAPIAPNSKTDKSLTNEDSYIIATTPSASEQAEPSTEDEETYTVLIRDFFLSVGVMEYPVFTLSAQNISNKTYNSTTPVSFTLLSGGGSIAVTGTGTFTFNPRYSMLDSKVEFRGIPINIEGALDYIQIKQFSSELEGRLHLIMADAANGSVQLYLSNKNMSAVPLQASTLGESIAHSIETLAALNIDSSIELKDRKLGNFQFTVATLRPFFNLISPVIERNLEGLRQKLETELASALEARVDMQADQAIALLNEPVETLTATASNLKEETSAKLAATEDVVLGFLAKEKERLQKQIEEETKKKIESAVEDLGSSFGF